MLLVVLSCSGTSTKVSSEQKALFITKCSNRSGVESVNFTDQWADIEISITNTLYKQLKDYSTFRNFATEIGDLYTQTTGDNKLLSIRIMNANKQQVETVMVTYNSSLNRYE